MALALPPAVAPAVQSSAPVAATSVVSAAHAAPYGWTSYTVRYGDTLIGIAARYRTTPGILASRNHISSPRALQAGARIQVPRTSAPPRQAAPRTVARSYTVRRGDTLSGIAARYGTTVTALAKANRIRTPSRIFVGQRIVVGRMSAAAARSVASGRPATYTVRSGDTLSAIAVRFHASVPALAKASHIRASSLLRIGQRLTLPSGARKTTASTSSGRYSQAVTSAADRNRARLAHRQVPTRSQTKALVVATARRYGVDPTLALAVAYLESGWNQRAVSPANAVGIMQVIPAGGQWASDLVGRRLDLLDAHDNVTAGVVMLRTLERSTKNTDQAIAAYYQGLGSLRARGMYADTKRYVANVKALRARM